MGGDVRISVFAFSLLAAEPAFNQRVDCQPGKARPGGMPADPGGKVLNSAWYQYGVPGAFSDAPATTQPIVLPEWPEPNLNELYGRNGIRLRRCS